MTVWLMILLAGFLSVFPTDSRALFLSSDAVFEARVSDRGSDLQTLQRILQSKQIRQRLSDLGLTEEEIGLRLAKLTDDQIHQLATRLDSLYAGQGDGLGTIILLLVIAILVVVLLQLTGHKIIITK
jgi:hypothetical protein